jgi:methionyl-tRNA synthetase
MTFYVTTPIYYVNSKPHIGHAYTTIAADILTRHHRQRGEETFFLTGVDEHATKVWRVAEGGLPAQEYVDQIAVVWRDLPQRLNAETSFFIRTSDAGHKEFVRDFLQRIYDNGDVYEDVYATASTASAARRSDRGRTGGWKCPDPTPSSGSRRRTTSSASRSTRTVARAVREQARLCAAWHSFSRVKSFVAGGLRDFSISRAGQP